MSSEVSLQIEKTKIIGHYASQRGFSVQVFRALVLRALVAYQEVRAIMMSTLDHQGQGLAKQFKVSSRH